MIVLLLSEAKTMEAMRNNTAMPPVYKKSCREEDGEEEEEEQLRTLFHVYFVKYVCTVSL